jgi:hypothetical protein
MLTLHLDCRQYGISDLFVVERYFTAMNSRGAGELSFEEVLLGLLALDPSTSDTGTWRHIRAEYIFK